MTDKHLQQMTFHWTNQWSDLIDIFINLFPINYNNKSYVRTAIFGLFHYVGATSFNVFPLALINYLDHIFSTNNIHIVVLLW